jgi:hypothetical protein
MDSDYRTSAKPAPKPEKRLPFWERVFPKKAPTEAELVKQEREKAIQALETRAHYLFRVLEHHPNLVEYTPVKRTHLYGLHLGYSMTKGLHFAEWHDPRRIDARLKGWCSVDVEWTIDLMEEAPNALEKLRAQFQVSIDKAEEEKRAKEKEVSQEREAWTKLAQKFESEND